RAGITASSSSGCRSIESEVDQTEAPANSFRLADGGQRLRYLFQRFALCSDTPPVHDCSRSDHQCGAKRVAGKDAGAGSGLDEVAHEQGAENTADAGADRVEACDRQSADLQRKGLADGEISRAGRSRGKKEDS